MEGFKAATGNQEPVAAFRLNGLHGQRPHQTTELSLS